MAFHGCDMIASLQHLPPVETDGTYEVKRAFIGDKGKILEFVREHFGDGWCHETERALLQDVSRCFIAVRGGELLGFACYDASAKGFFGPIGVRDDCRGHNVGRALLVRTLTAMRENGYAYAIIGWVNEAEHFYRKAVGAEFVPGGEPENSIYSERIEA